MQANLYNHCCVVSTSSSHVCARFSLSVACSEFVLQPCCMSLVSEPGILRAQQDQMSSASCAATMCTGSASNAGLQPSGVRVSPVCGAELLGPRTLALLLQARSTSICESTPLTTRLQIPPSVHCTATGLSGFEHILARSGFGRQPQWRELLEDGNDGNFTIGRAPWRVLCSAVTESWYLRGMEWLCKLYTIQNACMLRCLSWAPLGFESQSIALPVTAQPVFSRPGALCKPVFASLCLSSCCLLALLVGG